MASAGTAGVVKYIMKVTHCQIASCVSPFAQRKETICITCHVTVLLICFLIHYWDVFYQLLGFSWLCPSYVHLQKAVLT